MIDPIVDNPPTDIAVVRYRERRPLRSVLVPVAGGPNSRRVVRMAVNMAMSGEGGPAKVFLLHVIPIGARTRSKVRAEGCDLIVMGATEEPLFRNLLFGNIAEQIARRAEVTVILVKRRSGAIHSFLRQTVLEPTTN